MDRTNQSNKSLLHGYITLDQGRHLWQDQQLRSCQSRKFGLEWRETRVVLAFFARNGIGVLGAHRLGHNAVQGRAHRPGRAEGPLVRRRPAPGLTKPRSRRRRDQENGDSSPIRRSVSPIASGSGWCGSSSWAELARPVGNRPEQLLELGAQPAVHVGRRGRRSGGFYGLDDRLRHGEDAPRSCGCAGSASGSSCGRSPPAAGPR